MKKVLLMVSILGLASCGQATPDFDTMAKWNSVLLGDKTLDFCSGTVIGGGKDPSGEYSIVLTAEHCVSALDLQVSRRIDNDAGNTVWKDTKPAVVLYKNAATDIAILRTSLNHGGHWQAVAYDFDYARGKTIYVLGNPAVRTYASLTKGIVSAPPRPMNVQSSLLTLFQSDAFSMGGSSGAMVLNEFGEIVGAVTGGIPNSSIAFFTTIDNINAAIEAAGIQENIYRG